MANGIKIRNKQEQLAVNVMTEAHEYFNKVFQLNTSLTFQRECNWGKNAFHAGWYRDKDRTVALNFRNMYGATIQDLLEVLAHEIRHAYQYEFEFLSNHSGNAKSRSTYIRGTWKGQPMYVKYEDAPWEVDARAHEKPYSQEVIEALNISEEVLQTRLPMGSISTSDKEATYTKLNEQYGKGKYALLTKSWLNRKVKGSGIAYVIKADLPKGFNFKSKSDCQWLYDNQQLIHFMPYIKITEEYGGFSVRQMVS